MVSIKILGPGCPRCKATYEVVKKAVIENGITAQIAKVEDEKEMMKYDILSTPAVVLDGYVEIQGRVPTFDEISNLLNQYV
jgi:small redox-active disulfide protein 2